MDASTSKLPDITKTSPSQSRTEILVRSDPKKSSPIKESKVPSLIESRSWRSKDRIKTNAAVLALCLHLGIDPPDIVRPQPGADQLAGVHLPPMTKSPAEHRAAADFIAQRLQAHFEYWQPRCHYKTVVDPPVDELKRLCLSARKAAREDRVLFYYNGWGVPKPTKNGELWFFNANYTQYLPVNVQDLDTWLGPNLPLVVILECADAGLILNQWSKLRSLVPKTFYGFAAVDSGPTPSVPGMQGDLFTCSLVDPLKVALQHAKVPELPGKLNDRSTLLGQMHWIFTALTDTLGWQLFTRTSKPLSEEEYFNNISTFKQLYRQDVLLASLFRNYILAQIVMKCFGIKTVSIPDIPWKENELRARWDCLVDRYGQLASQGFVQFPEGEEDFFGDHLEAFERYTLLHQRTGIFDKTPNPKNYYPYLPIILQMLLSQQHRVRALEALISFVDLTLGPFLDNSSLLPNVRQILDVGIYPYLLKLLHTVELEARDVLAKLWLRLLLYDLGTADDLKGSSTLSSPPPWTFFVPHLPEDEQDTDVLLACLYLVSTRLGIAVFGSSLEEEIVTPQVAALSPIFCSLLVGRVRKSDQPPCKDQKYELLVKIHLDSTLTTEEQETLLFHEDPRMRIFYIHWLARSKMPNKEQELEEIFKNDPWQLVRDRAEEFLQDLRSDSHENEEGFLSKRMAKATLGSEDDIPLYLIRSLLLQWKPKRPLNIPSTMIKSANSAPSKLYEQFKIFENNSNTIMDLAFDFVIPGLIYLLARNGSITAFNYDNLTTVFENFRGERSIKAIISRNEQAGFLAKTAGEIQYEYGFELLPSVLISCPPILTPHLENAWRIPRSTSSDCNPKIRKNAVLNMLAELDGGPNNIYKVVLSGENERNVLEIPAASPGNSAVNISSNFNNSVGIMDTIKQGIKSFAHLSSGTGATTTISTISPKIVGLSDGCVAWHPNPPDNVALLAVAFGKQVFIYSAD